jgi:hypothetical protein
MTTYSLSAVCAVVLRKTFLGAAVAASGTILAFGSAGSALAAPPSTTSAAELARCQQLYGLWSKYNGTSSYSKNVTPEMALEQCNKGDTAGGIASLTKVLDENRIPVPPATDVAAH